MLEYKIAYEDGGEFKVIIPEDELIIIIDKVRTTMNDFDSGDTDMHYLISIILAAAARLTDYVREN